MEDGVIQEDDSALYTDVSNMATHIPRSRNQNTRLSPLNTPPAKHLW